MESDEIGGRYTIIERIGKGAMGVVFKAYDPVLDRVVAIKKMVAEIGQDEELRQRFYVEARAAARLNHRNIVTIHELEEADGEIYIVMELLEGVDLASVIRRRVPLPLEAKLNIVAQLCEGLDYAHRNGIVHRDIKPGNVHLGPTGLVKILDFGIARLASSTMTSSGALLGTPDYMSPEQVLGENIDARSDLFAVGGLLYELVASAKPFESESVASLLIKIAKSPHIPITNRVPDLPVALVSLVNRLLAKQRDLRPATAGAALAELRTIVQSTPGGSDTDAAALLGGIVTEQTMAIGSGTKATLPPPATPRPSTPRPAVSVPTRDSSPTSAPASTPQDSTSSTRLASIALLRGRELRKIGDLAGAMQVFRSVLEVAPGNSEALDELQALEADIRQTTMRAAGAPVADSGATILRPRGPEPPLTVPPPTAVAAATPPVAAPAASKGKSGAAVAIVAVLFIMAAAAAGTYYLLVIRPGSKPADVTTSAPALPGAASSEPPTAVASTSTSAPETASTASAPAPADPAPPVVADNAPAAPTSSVAPAPAPEPPPAPATAPAPATPAVDADRLKAEAARTRFVGLRQARVTENAPLPMRLRNEMMRFERQGNMAFNRGEYVKAATFFDEAGRIAAMRERPGRGNAGNAAASTPPVPPPAPAPSTPRVASGGSPTSSAPAPAPKPADPPQPAAPPPAARADDPPAPRPAPPREGTGDISTFTRGQPGNVGQMFNATPSVRATIARITDLIDRYAKAMEQRNLEALRMIRTELNPQEERIVRGKQISYKLDDLNVQPNGSEATATARRTVTGELESGARLNVSGPVSISLVRRPAGWVIVDVR